MLGERRGRRISRPEEDLRGRDRSRLLETANTLGEVLGGGISAGALGEAPGGGTPTSALREALGGCTSGSKGNPRGSDGPSREEALQRVRSGRTKIYLEQFFFSSRSQIRVRSANLFFILPPPSYHPLSQDISVTLVAHPLISPRPSMFPLVIPSQRVGQIWFVQIL